MSAAEKSPSERADAARRWWRSLQDETAKGESKPGNRAALAQLRRASAVGALAEEQTFVLFQALGYGQNDTKRLPRVATLACLLAHIRENTGESFGRAIGRQSIADKDSAKLKALRFQALIAANGEDEILRAFRRAVDILGGRANVADLARVVLFFDFDETRRKLAFDYYGAGMAAPDPETRDTTSGEA